MDGPAAKPASCASQDATTGMCAPVSMINVVAWPAIVPFTRGSGSGDPAPKRAGE
jgi:hypothetical protein